MFEVSTTPSGGIWFFAHAASPVRLAVGITIPCPKKCNPSSRVLDQRPIRIGPKANCSASRAVIALPQDMGMSVWGWGRSTTRARPGVDREHNEQRSRCHCRDRIGSKDAKKSLAHQAGSCSECQRFVPRSLYVGPYGLRLEHSDQQGCDVVGHSEAGSGGT
jgi:hypothetical protein